MRRAPPGDTVIRHESSSLLVVDKPAGVTVIPAPGVDPGLCLHHQLQAARGERLWVVHRLDRETSGLVAFARTADEHRRLSMAWEAHQVRKTYVAFTAGALEPAEGRIEIALHEARRGKARPAGPGEAGAKAAVTDYVVRRTWKVGDRAVSLVELWPKTGRHHQLRVHLRAAGAPILFDAVYGRGAIPPSLADGPCARLALHASRLDLPCRGGERMIVASPLPADLTALRGALDAMERAG